MPAQPPEHGRAGARQILAEVVHRTGPHLHLDQINGDRDPFGVPEPAGGVEVVVRPGATHDLRKDLAGTADAVLAWLRAHDWAR